MIISLAPEGQMGQMEMKCILYYTTWTKVTQVSDVAHGPLVRLIVKNQDNIGHSLY
jgi:hypothetical protein